jgi:hypothetical protein
MIRHIPFEAKSTEPPIGEVQMHFLTQPTLGTNAKAVADDQHADHQFWIDRRPPDLAIEGPQMGP